MEVFDEAAQILKNSHFNLNDAMLKQFNTYAKLLIEWNKKINLTAILDPKEIFLKHFLDSLLILDAYEIPPHATIIDIGTGAGFPGVPLKIVRPDINLTLLDSLNKRLNFLKELSSCLKIEFNIVHSRAEDAAKKLIFREKFDVVVSRAVASLNILLEYSVPFAKVGGFFLALKGSQAETELFESTNAQKCLNVELFSIKKFSLANKNDRSILVFKKISENSSIYPRNSAKILKKPL